MKQQIWWFVLGLYKQISLFIKHIFEFTKNSTLICRMICLILRLRVHSLLQLINQLYLCIYTLANSWNNYLYLSVNLVGITIFKFTIWSPFYPWCGGSLLIPKPLRRTLSPSCVPYSTCNVFYPASVRTWMLSPKTACEIDIWASVRIS